MLRLKKEESFICQNTIVNLAIDLNETVMEYSQRTSFIYSCTYVYVRGLLWYAIYCQILPCVSFTVMSTHREIQLRDLLGFVNVHYLLFMNKSDEFIK